MIPKKNDLEWVGSGWLKKKTDPVTKEVLNTFFTLSFAKDINKGDSVLMFRQDEEKLREIIKSKKGRDLTPNDPRFTLMRSKGGYSRGEKE